MHVESYCFRNCRYSPPWLQETTSDWPLCSRRDHKQPRWYPSHCVPGRDSLQPRTQIKKIAQDTDTENDGSAGERMFGKLPDCSFYLINFFPESPIPYLHFFPLRKKAGLKGKVRWSVRGQTHPCSQITGHLNKAPMKIHSLSLLTGSGRWQAAWTPAFLVSIPTTPSLSYHNFILNLTIWVFGLFVILQYCT